MQSEDGGAEAIAEDGSSYTADSASRAWLSLGAASPSAQTDYGRHLHTHCGGDIAGELEHVCCLMQTVWEIDKIILG